MSFHLPTEDECKFAGPRIKALVFEEADAAGMPRLTFRRRARADHRRKQRRWQYKPLHKMGILAKRGNQFAFFPISVGRQAESTASKCRPQTKRNHQALTVPVNSASPPTLTACHNTGMTLPALTREQSRNIDRRAIEEYGFSGLVLMENAGRGCVDVLERLGIDSPVVILCGKGNNAGDGFVIARHLTIRSYTCRVILLGAPAELRGDAATNLAILQKTSVPIIDLSPQRAGSSPTPSAELRSELDHHAHDAAWLVDALLGTGAIGEPRPPFDTAIDWINSRAATTKVLAVDLPSGLDCDTGQPAKHTVRADHTCTFATMKTGFLQPAAQPFLGTVHVCDIGVPLELHAIS